MRGFLQEKSRRRTIFAWLDRCFLWRRARHLTALFISLGNRIGQQWDRANSHAPPQTRWHYSASKHQLPLHKYLLVNTMHVYPKKASLLGHISTGWQPSVFLTVQKRNTICLQAEYADIQQPLVYKSASKMFLFWMPHMLDCRRETQGWTLFSSTCHHSTDNRHLNVKKVPPGSCGRSTEHDRIG